MNNYNSQNYKTLEIPHIPDKDPKALFRKEWQTLPSENNIKTSMYAVIQEDNKLVFDIDDIELNNVLESYLDKTLVTETGNGGRHYYFKDIQRVGTGIRISKLFHKGMEVGDIKASKSYVIGIGSSYVEDGVKKEYKQISTTDKVLEIDCKTIFSKLSANGITTGSNDLSKQQRYELRQRFKNELPPLQGTSNPYFYQASLWCTDEGFTKEEATTKIKRVFDNYKETKHYRNRPWSDVERTIEDVYSKKLTVTKGRPRNEDSIDRTQIALDIIANRKIFSDVDTETIYENKQGFPESINGTLRKELQRKYPEMETNDITQIISKLVGLADDIPPMNKDLKVFRNGTYSHKAKKLIETDDLAYMGFKNYDYIKNANPTKFKEIMFDNVKESEHPRIKAMLRSALMPKLDSRISVCYGKSGAGKSTGLTILSRLLGQDYALNIDLDKLLEDRFLTAKTKGKTFLYLQELPKTFKDFSLLKKLTGENLISERGFQQDVESNFDNCLKIASGSNHCSKIPNHEKDQMYSRRLSFYEKKLPKKPYPNDMDFEKNICEEEGSEILSWILNLTDEECQYEDKDILKEIWESKANPEKKWIEDNYEYHQSDGLSLHELTRTFKKENPDKIDQVDITSMKETVEELDYEVKAGQVKGIVRKLKVDKNVPKGQGTLDKVSK